MKAPMKLEVYSRDDQDKPELIVRGVVEITPTASGQMRVVQDNGNQNFLEIANRDFFIYKGEESET